MMASRECIPYLNIWERYYGFIIDIFHFYNYIITTIIFV